MRFRGSAAEQGWPRHVVILGGGFAAYQLATGLARKRYRVSLVSPRNHFLFTPLLTSTTVGTIEFRSIMEPLRLTRHGFSFFQAQALSLDPQRSSVCCRSTLSAPHDFTLTYDYLVIAVGARPHTYGIEGVEQHAVLLKELADAREIRRRIIANVEEASLPGIDARTRDRLLNFVVVGGGPTGCEFAGELHDFLQQDLRAVYPHFADKFRILLLEGSETILSSFDRDLQHYARRAFQRQHIEVRTNSPVTSVTADAVTLADGSLIPYGLLVWSTGVGPTTFVKELALAKDGRGRLLTDEYLRIPEHPEIYAMGDCAAVNGREYPMTGQYAQQAGRYLAHTLNRIAVGREVAPFHYRDLGMLAYIGNFRALADTPHKKWRGVLAWLLWRSVYITRLVSIRNKVRVLFDWTKAWIFGRDATSF